MSKQLTAVELGEMGKFARRWWQKEPGAVWHVVYSDPSVAGQFPIVTNCGRYSETGRLLRHMDGPEKVCKACLRANEFARVRLQ